MSRAVVFAYHDVGVRCLKVLLARGVEVPLVVTHADDPREALWFGSVAAMCRESGIACIAPAAPDEPELEARLKTLAPDFLFSFYYRHMLAPRLLALAKHGAFNMHGSLLPKYRGRAPVNWAVLHGESETGATLHEMVTKPDAGLIVGQTAVPILPDDTAHKVFAKVTVAAEQTLWNALPGLLAGTAPRRPNRLSEGSYFGQRRPEDGRIDWSQPALAIYNLHRAVAPPYPGAFTEVGGRVCTLVKARLAGADVRGLPPGLCVMGGRIFGTGGDGRSLHIHALRAGEELLTPDQLERILAGAAFPASQMN